MISRPEYLRRLHMRMGFKPRRRVRRSVFPTEIMKEYQTDVEKISAVYASAVRRILIPAIPNLLQSVQFKRPQMDSVDDELNLLMKSLRRAFGQSVSDATIERVARDNAVAVNRFNRRDQGRLMAAIIGIDPIGSEAWVNQEVNLFTSANVKLIQNLTDQTETRIETNVLEAARHGWRPDELIGEIENSLKVSENHARFIARDQISKFNGDITKLRQVDAGFPAYRWETSHDARVRDTHAAHDGQVYLWGDSPSDTGAPGEDYQCRCVAIPVTQEEYDQLQEAA